jgi:hypothetical protein
MKVGFALTLDGMLRALRTRLHHVQDDLQEGATKEQTDRRAGVMRDRHRERREERDGDRRG